MSEIVEHTPHGVVLEDASGDRRRVLTECPAPDCEQRLAGVERGGADDGRRDGPPSLSRHLRTAHRPQDFGLSPLRRARQGRLAGFVGGETA